jgi:hypothetical protein
MRSDWFTPYDSVLSVTPAVPPQPLVVSIWEDDDGRVWVFGLAPDPHWRAGLGEPRLSEGQRYHPIERAGEVYDGVIEVVDVGQGRAVAERRLDDVGWGMLLVEPGLVASRRESEDGWWFVDVWQVELAPRSLRR